MLIKIQPYVAVFRYLFTGKSLYMFRVSQHLGHTVAQFLRHCATGRMVAGLIPDGVIVIFELYYYTSLTMALGVDSTCNGNEYQE